MRKSRRALLGRPPSPGAPYRALTLGPDLELDLALALALALTLSLTLTLTRRSFSSRLGLGQAKQQAAPDQL